VDRFKKKTREEKVYTRTTNSNYAFIVGKKRKEALREGGDVMKDRSKSRGNANAIQEKGGMRKKKSAGEN